MTVRKRKNSTQWNTGEKVTAQDLNDTFDEASGNAGKMTIVGSGNLTITDENFLLLKPTVQANIVTLYGSLGGSDYIYGEVLPAFDNTYMYVPMTFGTVNGQFCKINMSTGAITSLANIDSNNPYQYVINNAKTKIYATHFSSNDFYEYDIAGNTWTLKATLNVTVGQYGSMAMDASDNVYIKPNGSGNIYRITNPTTISGTPTLTVWATTNQTNTNRMTLNATHIFIGTQKVTLSSGAVATITDITPSVNVRRAWADATYLYYETKRYIIATDTIETYHSIAEAIQIVGVISGYLQYFNNTTTPSSCYMKKVLLTDIVTPIKIIFPTPNSANATRRVLIKYINTGGVTHSIVGAFRKNDNSAVTSFSLNYASDTANGQSFSKADLISDGIADWVII